MDTWNSTQARISRQLPAEPKYPKPMSEEAFNALDVGTNVTPIGWGSSANSNESIWGEVAELTKTLTQVILVSKKHATQPPGDGDVAERTRELVVSLNKWEVGLPAHLQNTTSNQKMFLAMGRGREFAVPHLIFHYQCIILFFPHLTTRTEDSTSIADTQTCCAHARSLSQLMWITNTTSGMECLWSPVNGHLIVVASTVLLHSLLFDQSLSGISSSRRLLEQNFVMLLQLQKYWPTLKYSLNRLGAIHRACAQGYGARVFVVDEWMSSFLAEYGSDVGERFPVDDSSAKSPSSSSKAPELPTIFEQTWSSITATAMDQHNILHEYLSFQ